MSEFMLVDHPLVHPQACVVCGSAKGPTADTGVERWGERLYQCRTCTTRFARAYGLTKGPKMEELLAAADELDERDRQIGVLVDEIQRLKVEAAGLRATVKDLQASTQERAARLQAAAHISAELERQIRELTELAVGPMAVEAAA